MQRSMFIPAALALMIPAAAVAHHGWSSYDESKVVRVIGSLSSVSWSNPHGTATMNWEGRRWDVILAPTSRMEARGLTQAMIEPGERIRLVGYPRRDGTAEIRVERVLVGDKTVELR